MTTAADQLDDTPSPTDLRQFIYLANSLVELLETTKRELDSDREAAKASLATASSILQSEIERRLRAKGARPGALAAWQIARVPRPTRFLRHEQGEIRRSAASRLAQTEIHDVEWSKYDAFPFGLRPVDDPVYFCKCRDGASPATSGYRPF
jgi:hypothetical protein